MSGNRQLPHDINAEASVLGGVIVDNDRLALLESIEVDDFYDHRHKAVFTAIRNLEAAKRPVDVVTVESEVSKAGKLDAIGGIAFIGELTLRVPTSSNVEEYAKIVLGHSITRQVMLMLGEMLEEAYTGLSEGEQLIHDVAAALMHVRTGKQRGAETIADASLAELKRINADVAARANGGSAYSGIPTGFVAIDERMGGHPIGVATTYIARPGNGKTTIAMAIAKAANRIAGEQSLIASYEDSGQSFAQRAIAQEGGISTEKVRSRRVTNPEDMRALSAAEWNVRSRTELLLGAAGMEVEELVRRVRRENLRRKHEGKKPIRQLIVDYIQKIPTPRWARSREEGVSHISRVLSTFADTDQMAVVIMSQLNRESEKRDDHRPRLSDIRDSGAIEQDSKVIFGIYCPYQYEPNKHDASQLKLLVLKNAQGESMQELELYWDRATHGIYNSALDYQQARAMR